MRCAAPRRPKPATNREPNLRPSAAACHIAASLCNFDRSMVTTYCSQRFFSNCASRLGVCRIIVGFLLALTLAMPARALTFARGGKAAATIVVAAGATASEQMAANEVADYLRRISGADFHVLTEDQAPAKGSRVFVGPTAFARRNGLTADKLGPEEWVIRTVGSDLMIIGGQPRGTIYGGVPLPGGRAGSALVESVGGERAAAQDRCRSAPSTCRASRPSTTATSTCSTGMTAAVSPRATG